MSLLDLPLVKRIRQNHALEHATVHLLARSSGPLRLVGRSDWDGYVLYGKVDTRAVLRAATEGLARLKRGESALAVHSRCGTNLALMMLLGGGAAYSVSRIPTRSWFKRLVAVAAAAMGVVAVAPPLGLWLQRRVTTCADVSDIHINAIRQESMGSVMVHRIQTTGTGKQ